MRSPELHAALRDLTADAGALLARALEHGAEVPFEVVEEGDGGRGGRGPVLYRYRPLTDAFIESRWPALQQLDAYAGARAALGGRAGPYLRHRGIPGSNPDLALRDLLERMFDEATSFDFPGERFERIAAELEATLDESTVTATVVAPVHGVRIASQRVELEEGLSLVRRSALPAPPTPLEGSLRAPETTAEAAGEATSSEASPFDVFCVYAPELPVDERLPVDEARVSFRRVLTALRLCGAGGTALGPLGFARAGAGAWHPVALGVSARVRPEWWELDESEEPELRQLLGLLSRSRHGPAVAFALARFEMGCERSLETEALSDYLLGLRALLGSRDGGDGPVAERLAVLCSAEDDRDGTADSVRDAYALECRLLGGAGDRPDALALESPRILVREVEQHLRALLRDVLCGYLDDDLRSLADELLGTPEHAVRRGERAAGEEDGDRSPAPGEGGALPPEGDGDRSPAPGEGGALAPAEDGAIHVRDTRRREGGCGAAADEDTAELEGLGAAVTPTVLW